MENGIKKYWRSVEELHNSPQFVQEASNEFAEELPLDEILSDSSALSSNRRDFLKMFGFSVTAATLAACTKTPIKKAVPWVTAPEDISPSIANYYSGTFSDGHDYCAIVVKTREGRPIKIEGNTASSVTNGGVNARVNASILGLYDTVRYKHPMIDGKPVSWNTVDTALSDAIKKASADGKSIQIITPSIHSPSAKNVLQQFLAKYPQAKHIVYDEVSYSGILEANAQSFGSAVIPNYRFENAEVILGIGADFLGNWINPVGFTKQYVKNRQLNPEIPKMSKHFQFESWLSITGSNADHRATYSPSQEGAVVATLYNAIASLTGKAKVSVASVELAGNSIQLAAKALVAAQGKSLVVCGSNDTHVQVLVNGINAMLGNLGNTIDFANPYLLKQGIDANFENFTKELAEGKVGLVMFADGVNPLYSHPNASQLLESLKKATVVAMHDRPNETAVNANIIAPNHHYLESWSDAEPMRNHFSVGQPAITPLFDTRQQEETLLRLMGSSANMYDVVRDTWRTLVFSKQTQYPMFDAFWRNALYTGVIEMPAAFTAPTFTGDVIANAAKIQVDKSTGLQLVAYEKVGLGNGSMANNPWLQELPDPISRACWDNYLAVSKKYADEQGLKEGDIVKVSANNYSVEVPVLIQPGQIPTTVALALGYGRKNAGKVADNLGGNAFGFTTLTNGTRQPYNLTVTVDKTGKHSPLAQTQTHHTIEGRDIVKETTLEEYVKNRGAGNVRPYLNVKGEDGHSKKVHPSTVTLWDEYDYKGHHWVMAIDLNACTGCGSCVVACQSENNVPVVGKDEVIRRREMHWIRIDRYYAFKNKEAKRVDKEQDYSTIDKYEDVDVVFQPVMCQQCNHAPCETVCPVLATMHSDEGLNQMAYNRCVGTRYCANNCPYKVRRFNWFNYNYNDKFVDVNSMQQDSLGKMVLNPDVTVRSRGVMEKCTFCVQRIQAGKLEAKKQGKRPEDGSIKTACQQTCPANAIVFGDLNDPNSEVAKLFKNERGYGLIEEINTQPNVRYLTKVRNRNSQPA